MDPINCCRTCLSEQSLYPIFVHSEHSEKYSDLIYLCAGVQVEINDNLPQLMCTDCITFVNEFKIFRKRCEDTQKMLLDHNTNSIKLERHNPIKVKYEKSMHIDISEFLNNDDDFKDYDDNVTLDVLQCNSESNKTNNESENQVPAILNTPVDEQNIKIPNRKKTNVKMKPERIKSKLEAKKGPKKEKKESERIKEEIECEYCHKILTSKLSLRNHYKIHTGFDVVCEHCGKKFITRRLLLMHCRAKHGYEKTDKCSFCDYRASNAEQVKIHERLHTGERPFVCKECGAGFHRKSSYLQHVAIHLPEKTVQCGQCPARFKSLTLMRIHAQRHRAPRYAFKCGACAGTFARRRNVARHLQRVHALPPDHTHIERLQLH